MRVILADKQTSGWRSLYASEEYGEAVAAADGGSWIEVRDEDARWRIPLVTRQIPGSLMLDAATPYGYGGVHVPDGLSIPDITRLWEDTREALSDAGIVSMFLRFPPFAPAQAARLTGLPGLVLSAVSQTFVVPLADDAIMWAAMQKRGRYAVRTAEKSGCRAEIVVVDDRVLRDTRELYEQTMRRVGAADHYFFPDEYYERLKSLGDRMKVARVLNSRDEVVAASFILSDEQHAHYHLSGSTGTESGANNLMIWAVMQWAAAEGITGLHLGGGLTVGDSLHRFKASFGGSEATFHIGKAVLHADHYRELVEQRAAELGVEPTVLGDGPFFPAYRTVGGTDRDEDLKEPEDGMARNVD